MLRSRRVLCNNVELARRIAVARWPHVALVVCFGVCVWCVPRLPVVPAVQAAEGGRERVIVPLSGIRIYTDTNSRLLQTVLPPPDAPELSEREKKRLFDALLSDIRSESHLDYLNDGWGHHLCDVTTWILHCTPEKAQAILAGLVACRYFYNRYRRLENVVTHLVRADALRMARQPSDGSPPAALNRQGT